MAPYTKHLTPVDVGRLLGVSPRTLSRWHAQRLGPPRCKVGRTVLYRQEAVEHWLRENEINPTRKFSNV
ncbi:helix-turn-helix domain-containing protein [Seohaeicola saemankumensis]|uniref:Helix-turn-helix domain-containing protein n=1 Tax=Seohaeicola saemankumensis TaxID=481181 RepID=A0ABW3T9U3_9RHOB